MSSGFSACDRRVDGDFGVRGVRHSFVKDNAKKVEVPIVDEYNRASEKYY